MTGTFFHAFRFAWLRFFRFPGEKTQQKLSPAEYSLVVPVTPLVGAVEGLLIWAVLILVQRIAGRTAAAILGAAVIPPVLEYITGERGIRALFAFLIRRERGIAPMEILRTGLEDKPDSPLFLPEKMLMPTMILLLRSCLYAVIWLQSGGFWFLFTWTGVFLLFAELSLMPGENMKDIFSCPVSWSKRNCHVLCAAGVFLMAGLALREPIAAGIGFFAAWAMARGAVRLQRRAGGKTDRAVMALYGIGAEILLLFLGVLLFAD